MAKVHIARRGKKPACGAKGDNLSVISYRAWLESFDAGAACARCQKILRAPPP